MADVVTLLKSPIDELHTRIEVCEHSQGAINNITKLNDFVAAIKIEVDKVKCITIFNQVTRLEPEDVANNDNVKDTTNIDGEEPMDT